MMTLLLPFLPLYDNSARRWRWSGVSMRSEPAHSAMSPQYGSSVSSKSFEGITTAQRLMNLWLSIVRGLLWSASG